MSDARTKLRAFAPAFLEVIEELERKISANYQHLQDRHEALVHVHAMRLEALEADRAELEPISERIEALERIVTEERTQLTQLFYRVERIDERTKGDGRKRHTLSILTPFGTVTAHGELQALEHVAELWKTRPRAHGPLETKDKT